jgi:hypothetical protein
MTTFPFDLNGSDLQAPVMQREGRLLSHGRADGQDLANASASFLIVAGLPAATERA